MKSDRDFLLHIIDAVGSALRYSSGGEAEFFSDPKTQDAVLRKLEVIGEATKRLSPGLKSEYPSIPWRQIAGMRDKLIHDYFGVDLTLVWNVVGQVPPGFESECRRILAEFSDGN